MANSNQPLFFDSSNKLRMQEFLNHIYTIAKQNPNIHINSKIIYNQLKFYGLPKSELDEYNQGISNRQFFDKWERKFAHKKNIKAFCDEFHKDCFFQFKNGLDPRKHYIKLYVPINAPHLFKGVNELFEFLEKENIQHMSYVAEQARFDNVIIRLDAEDTESLNKIINYINNNKYLKTGLNYNNPFIPSISGIGCMNEHGNSYNRDISHLIENYINQCIAKNTFPNIDEFRNYVKMNSYDFDLIETFENSFNSKRQYKTISQRDNTDSLSIEQKTYLVIDALKATYLKYGMDQVRGALDDAVIAGRFDRFTNDYHLRDRIKEYLTKEDFIRVIKYALPNFVHPKLIGKEIYSKAHQFANLLFEDTLLLSLDEACMATLEKFDETHLAHAIFTFISSGDASKFTRSGLTNTNINYREQIIKIGQENLLEYIKKSLKLKGYDDIDVEKDIDIVHIYAEHIKNSRYTTLNDSPKVTR